MAWAWAGVGSGGVTLPNLFIRSHESQLVACATIYTRTRCIYIYIVLLLPGCGMFGKPATHVVGCWQTLWDVENVPQTMLRCGIPIWC